MGRLNVAFWICCLAATSSSAFVTRPNTFATRRMARVSVTNEKVDTFKMETPDEDKDKDIKAESPSFVMMSSDKGTSKKDSFKAESSSLVMMQSPDKGVDEKSKDELPKDDEKEVVSASSFVMMRDNEDEEKNEDASTKIEAKGSSSSSFVMLTNKEESNEKLESESVKKDAEVKAESPSFVMMQTSSDKTVSEEKAEDTWTKAKEELDTMKSELSPSTETLNSKTQKDTANIKAESPSFVMIESPEKESLDATNQEDIKAESSSFIMKKSSADESSEDASGTTDTIFSDTQAKALEVVDVSDVAAKATLDVAAEFSSDPIEKFPSSDTAAVQVELADDVTKNVVPEAAAEQEIQDAPVMDSAVPDTVADALIEQESVDDTLAAVAVGVDLATDTTEEEVPISVPDIEQHSQDDAPTDVVMDSTVPDAVADALFEKESTDDTPAAAAVGVDLTKDTSEKEVPISVPNLSMEQDSQDDGPAEVVLENVVPDAVADVLFEKESVDDTLAAVAVGVDLTKDATEKEVPILVPDLSIEQHSQDDAPVDVVMDSTVPDAVAGDLFEKEPVDDTLAAVAEGVDLEGESTDKAVPVSESNADTKLELPTDDLADIAVDSAMPDVVVEALIEQDAIDDTLAAVTEGVDLVGGTGDTAIAFEEKDELDKDKPADALKKESPSQVDSIDAEVELAEDKTEQSTVDASETEQTIALESSVDSSLDSGVESIKLVEIPELDTIGESGKKVGDDALEVIANSLVDENTETGEALPKGKAGSTEPDYFFATQPLGQALEEPLVQQLEDLRERKALVAEMIKEEERESDVNLLQQLQATEDALKEVKTKSESTIAELKEETRKREAKWKEEIEVLRVKLEVAEDLHASAQTKLQDMFSNQFDYESEAEEWKKKYANDKALWSTRYERERVSRRNSEAQSRERISELKRYSREQLRNALEEEKVRKTIERDELARKVAEMQRLLEEKDATLKELRDAAETKEAQTGRSEDTDQAEATSVRKLLRQALGLVRKRVRNRWRKLRGKKGNNESREKSESNKETADTVQRPTRRL